MQVCNRPLPTGSAAHTPPGSTAHTPPGPTHQKVLIIYGLVSCIVRVTHIIMVYIYVSASATSEEQVGDNHVAVSEKVVELAWSDIFPCLTIHSDITSENNIDALDFDEYGVKEESEFVVVLLMVVGYLGFLWFLMTLAL